MTRKAVVVLSDIARPWVLGVGNYESKYHSCYGEYECAIEIIKAAFAGSDVEFLPRQWGSGRVHINVYTKDRVDFYGTSFLFKTVNTVVDFSS